MLDLIAATMADKVWAVVPADEQSGAGHSLTLTRPLRPCRFGERKFAVGGPPADAVMMALAHVMKAAAPDLILSDVKRGANRVEDMTNSGTVAAAIEDALAGAPSIALSQVFARQGRGDEVPFAAAEAWAQRIIGLLIAERMPPSTLMNVNFPALPTEEIKGIRLCLQGQRDYGRLTIDQRRNPRGFGYDWFGLAPTVETPSHLIDLEIIADDFVAVTPLHLVPTHEPSLDPLAGQFG